MRSLVHSLAALLLALASAPALPASGYDIGDMWWVPSEPGWGAEFVQQRDTVFAVLYVQGPDQRPDWYSATLFFQGLEPQTHQVTYAGDLYEAQGAWFGVPAYAITGMRKVGTMSVVAPTMTSATLTYTVDGTSVTKPIARYTFRYEQYAPAYDATSHLELTSCTNPADNGAFVHHPTYAMTLAGLQMTIAETDGVRSCTYVGPYTQDGRLGRVQSTYTCNNGEVGAMTFEEMNVQRFGLVGKLFGANNRGCHIEGSFGAVPQ